MTMTIATSCGNHKKDYEETYTAEDWEAEQMDMEVTDVAPQEFSDSDFRASEEQVEVVEVAAAASDSTIAPPNDSASAGREDLPDSQPRRRVPSNYVGNMAEVFNDSNHFQLNHARRLGIQPISDLRSYYHTSRPLVKVATNEDFRVDNLTHSYPYLVPEADKLLHDIGHAFREKVKERKGGDYRMVVTSLLRTPDTVRKLRRINRNATEQSTHQYATTFDISYNKFDCVSGPDNASYYDLKMILAEVIRELHLEGRCMVKYEIKSPCFHITATR